MSEEILEPELPIIDPHHHLWDLRPLVPAFPEPRHDFIEAIAGAAYYTFDELLADTSTGHNIIGTVFMECGAQELTFLERSGFYFGFLFGICQMVSALNGRRHHHCAGNRFHHVPSQATLL